MVAVGLFDGERAVVIGRSLLGPLNYESPYGGFAEDRPWPELLTLLAQFDLELHNALFDLPTLTSRLTRPGVDPETYGLSVGFDTMLSHYVIRPAAEQSLKLVAKQVLNVEDWDRLETFPRLTQKLYENREDWWKYAYPVMEELVERTYGECLLKAMKSSEFKQWQSKHDKEGGDSSTAMRVLNEYAHHRADKLSETDIAGTMDMKALGLAPEFAVQLYNAFDVIYTWDMRNFLEPRMAKVEGAQKASKLLHAFSNRIMWDQLNGFPVDTDRATELCDLITTEIAEHREQLIEWAHAWVDPKIFPKKQFNPGSPKQVKQVYASVGHKLESTNEKTMSKLVERGDQFAAKLLAYRSVDKEYGTYAKKIRDDYNDVLGEPRLFPWYNLCRTLTGRLSSSGVLNIQNQPKQEDYAPERQLRGLYTSTKLLPDYTLLQVDYSQAELRVMAAESNDDWLTSIFEDSSVDIFTQMTRQIFPHIKDEQQIKLWRRPLKAVVYGLAFGRQAPAIAFELGIPVHEAQNVMNAFLTRADELDVWRQWVMKQAASGGDLITRLGRHFQHEVITNINKANVQRSALSFIPQSTASDLTLLAYIGLRDWIKENNRPWFFRAIVHDALTYDVPMSQMNEANEVIGHFMVKSAKAVVPEVPFAVDGNHALTWNKTG